MPTTGRVRPVYFFDAPLLSFVWYPFSRVYGSPPRRPSEGFILFLYFGPSFVGNVVKQVHLSNGCVRHVPIILRYPRRAPSQSSHSFLLPLLHVAPQQLAGRRNANKGADLANWLGEVCSGVALKMTFTYWVHIINLLSSIDQQVWGNDRSAGKRVASATS